MDTISFQEVVWEKGRELYRDMPWRQNTDPYWVLVSEMMLQQTQVDRVIPKFEAFIKKFPTINALADASLADVVILWSGLGYNRRARFLHESAQQVVSRFSGKIPNTQEDLETLPGVGQNTAGAILAYAFNEPVVYIETNIRTVYFYHFFPEAEAVSDVEIRTLAAQTIDKEHPREWYWAMMDYGFFLKRQGAGQLYKGLHYKKQSKLEGSVRETRGVILKELTARSGSIPRIDLKSAIQMHDRFDAALAGLLKDGLVEEKEDSIRLKR